jgi:hypothetical protein
MSKLLPARAFQVAGHLEGKQGGDDRLVVWPPELHILPVLLQGLAVQIPEVEEAAELLVPAAPPHPVEHRQADPLPGRVPAQARFMEDKPGCLDGVAGIEDAPVEVMKPPCTWSTPYVIQNGITSSRRVLR